MQWSMLESLMTCSILDASSPLACPGAEGCAWKVSGGFTSRRATPSSSKPEVVRKVLRSEGLGLAVFVIDDR
jgi:hypothetical protein